MPLGSHLSQATKEKILRWEYVDLFPLLNREREDAPWVERIWENWLPAFLIYAYIIMEAHLCRALSLIHYLDLILRAYQRFEGPAWRHYDEAFRRQAALDPSLPWGRIHVPLWLRYMTPARPIEGELTDSGHLIPARPVATRPSRRLCRRFSSQGTCPWQPCKFAHRCSFCGGAHGFTACRQWRRARFWRGRKKSPSGGTPPEEDDSD